MKKILTILCVFCLICPFVCTLAGCQSQPQITMEQIQTEIKTASHPTIEGEEPVTFRYYDKSNNIYEIMLDWQRDFERNNIDTRDFMAMDKYYYYFENIDIQAYVYVFKFATIEASKNCCKNFDFSEHLNAEYKSKTYGNLVVAVKSEIANYIFNIIKNIKN